MWKRRRIAMLRKRDGGSCWLCALPLLPHAPRGGKRTSIEHLVPRALGGGDALENLVLCHEACNRHLRDHPAEKKARIRDKWHRERARIAAARAPSGRAAGRGEGTAT